MDSLPPLPIDFDEAKHEYTWRPTGERMAQSVTTVCSTLKTKWELESIERYRPDWEPRGLHVHKALENFLNGVPKDDLLGTEWDAWVSPMLDHPFWESFEPIATEYRLCDLSRSIGGSFDCLGYDHFTDRLVLLDLKSQSNRGKRYKTDAQLGGYLSMLIDQRKVLVDECLTFWARPGEAKLGDTQPPDRCLGAWEDTYSVFSMLEERV